MRQLIVRLRYILFSVIILIGFSSCLTTQHLPQGTALLKANKITFQSDTSTKSAQFTPQDLSLASKLTTLAKQQPNTKTLGFIKLNLMVYNRFYTEKEKGLFHFLMTKVGEAPVLFDSTLLFTSSKLMQQYMLSKGYLKAKVFADYRIKHRKATALFHVISGPLWTIRQITFPDTINLAAKVIFQTSPQTLLKEGNPLDNDMLYQEQARIVKALQDQGYYRFRNDFIYFEADTTVQRYQANIYMKLEQTADSSDLKPFKINNISIYADFDPEKKSDTLHYDTTQYHDWRILQHQLVLKKPLTYYTTVFLHSGDYYSRSNVECTFNRLYNLGIFKFINVQWKELPDQRLDASIFMTPGKKQSVSAQLEANNIESSLGSGVQLTYQSKNVLKQANLFSTILNAGIEAPVFNQAALDSIRVNLRAQMNFSLPRFAVPFIRPRVSCLTDPHTVVTLQANVDVQTKVYSLASYSVSFGYDWRQSPTLQWVATPLFISYVQPYNISDSFQKELDLDPFLAEAFQQQFITGLSGSLIFNNQKLGEAGNYSYLRLSSELSGTLLYPIAKAAKFPMNEGTGQFTILNNAFSNYYRIEGDGRHYLDFRKDRLLVLRLDAGVAFNYWNSLAVPYVKQFFVGGTSSMRAWPLRKLGPGGFVDTVTTGYYNNTGDMILEGDVEYRFPIISKLKGAVFTDAGNVWLRNKDTSKPNGEFHFNSFYKQIGIGSGVGLRLDFTYFLIRVDAAFQIYNPGEPNGDPWVIKYFDPGSPTWRRTYSNLSLAIGYPF